MICPRCHGKKTVTIQAKNHGTYDWDEHIIPCPMCGGKGHYTEEDRKAYYLRISF